MIPNNEIDNESFNEVISISEITNDERIIEYFKSKSISRGDNKLEASDSVFEMISEKDLSEQLEIKVWEKLSKFPGCLLKRQGNFVSLNLKTVEEWYRLKENTL